MLINFTTTNIIFIGFGIIGLIYMYEFLGYKSILLLIPIILLYYQTNKKVISKNLLSKQDKLFLKSIDLYLLESYQQNEIIFFQIINEYKLFNNNKEKYKSLLYNYMNEMKMIFSSFSLSTLNIKQEVYLKNIYNNWLSNINVQLL